MMALLSNAATGTSLRRRIAMAAASIGLAGSLLLAGSSPAKADGPYTGYFSLTPGQEQWNPNWNQNWNQPPWWEHDRDWDRDWWDNNGWWDNDGFWRSNQWYNNQPVVYTYNQPVWDPYRMQWVVYNQNRPILYTHQQPLYRPTTGLYVVITVTFGNPQGYHWSY